MTEIHPYPLPLHLFDELFAGFLDVVASVAVDREVGLEGVVFLDHPLHGRQILAKIIAAKNDEMMAINTNKI